MKANLQNVLIGAVTLAAFVYFVYPTAFLQEGYAGEQPQSEKIGGYIAIAIFLFVVIGGMIAAFSAGGSK
jgi:hypothetical protein